MDWLWPSKNETPSHSSSEQSSTSENTETTSAPSTPAPLPTEQPTNTLSSYPPLPTEQSTYIPSSHPSPLLETAYESTQPLTPQNLYPTSLSCRTTFDTAFYCASLGGQFTSIYRYGSLRRCSDEWADFWWCVRTNRGWMSDEEREEKVMRRAWEREQRMYHAGEGGAVPERGGSSEDVWERRRGVVKKAFRGDWDAIRENKAEVEAGERRMIEMMRQMGYGRDARR